MFSTVSQIQRRDVCGKIMTAFHHGVAGDQKCLSRTGTKAGRVISDTEGYFRRSNALGVEELLYSVD
jgi:hypothetical protein